MKKRTKKIAVFGGGPAALMLAGELGATHEVTIYEKEKTVGRKFLVAGKGGFNLSHDFDIDQLIQEYTSNGFLEVMLRSFDVVRLRAWLESIGIPTYVGSSRRVFPQKGIKPIEVLQQWKAKLTEQQVDIKTQHSFVGFNSDQLPIIETAGKQTVVIADAYVFALGGASWSVTGSDGHWVKAFRELGIQVHPFQASNCGLNIHWPDSILAHHTGKPLKNISVSCGGKQIVGEALISEYGLEGNAIYPIVPQVRHQLAQGQKASIEIDFKPQNTLEQLLQKQGNVAIKTKQYAQKLKLNTTALALLKSFTSKSTFLDSQQFITQVKKLTLPVDSLRPIEEAISTIGGIALSELHPNCSLKKHPHLFAIGEMLDWDAPTGGFLLQACFSMGHYVAREIAKESTL